MNDYEKLAVDYEKLQYAHADAVHYADSLKAALVHAHDTMLMVNGRDLGRSDREALDAAREHAKRVLEPEGAGTADDLLFHPPLICRVCHQPVSGEGVTEDAGKTWAHLACTSQIPSEAK